MGYQSFKALASASLDFTMVNEETNESEATDTTIPTHHSEDSAELEFSNFPVTPNLEDVREELKGTKLEPLLNVIASHPTDMKDVILGQATKILKLNFKLRQKQEALAKQLSLTEEQTSYIPGSLRSGNPINGPNYIKGSAILEEIVERGNNENEAKKEQFASIAVEMTRAVTKETNSLIQEAFLDAVGVLAKLLVVP